MNERPSAYQHVIRVAFQSGFGSSRTPSADWLRA